MSVLNADAVKELRLDQAVIDLAAQDVAAALIYGRTVAVGLAPGNMTNYRLVVATCNSMRVGGNDMTGITPEMRGAASRWVLLSWLGHGAVLLELGGVHWTYVMEKFECNMADAVPIAALLDAVDEELAP